MAGINLKSGHCRENCTSKGRYDCEERLLLYTGAGDVAESIRNAECGLWWWTPTAAPVPSLHHAEWGRVG